MGNASCLIKDATGNLYKDFLIELRIEKAKELLLNESLSIKETAQNVGYASIPHFIKLFKKMTGETPASFQKNNSVPHDKGKEPKISI